MHCLLVTKLALHPSPGVPDLQISNHFRLCYLRQQIHRSYYGPPRPCQAHRMIQGQNLCRSGSIDNVLETLEGNDSAGLSADFGPVAGASL